MNKDALKKYHFWILFAPFLVFVAIGVVVLWTVIGPKIEAKQAEHEKAAKEAEGKRAGVKPAAEVDLLRVLNKKFEETRVSKWKQNWDMQVGLDDAEPQRQTGENLFRWPTSPLLNGFNYAPGGKGLAFGGEIPYDRGERNAFKDRVVYLAEYSTLPYGTAPTADKPDAGTGMADKMYPTQFAGGWSAVLRHVYTADAATGYGWSAGRPSSAEIWLALEDLWVQRSLLTTLKGMNDRQAAFADRDPRTGEAFGPATATRRVYRNRTWQLDLQIVDRPADGKKVLVGKLSNLTPRVQMFGMGGRIAFKVFVGEGTVPADLVFNERYLTGAGGKKKKLNGAAEVEGAGDAVEVPPEKGVELDKLGVANPTLREAAPGQPAPVRQVFDARTVPLQRIDRLVLGYPDSRNAMIAPKQPSFLPEEPAAGTGTETGSPMGGPGPGSSSSSAPPTIGGPAGPGSGGGAGGVGAGWPVLTGPVTSKTLLDVTKKRYLGDVTPQIRRMPVGMVVVIDQSNLQDLLLALANSPLRFQVTQVHWARFRGTLGTEAGGSGGYGPSYGGGGASIGAIQGGGFEVGGGGLRPGGGPRGPGSSSSPAGPMGSSASVPGPGAAAFGGGETGTDADVQMTSGLVEVSVYGIISLYEKYDVAKDKDDAAAQAGGATAPK